MNWTNQVAIVTGGASGIGAGTVRELAARGARVAIFDINQLAGNDLAYQLRETGAQSDFYEVDVSNEACCFEAVDKVAETSGHINILVNDAASFISKGLDVTTEDWEHSLGVNVRGYSNMVRACYMYMKRDGGGAIVNLASISGYIAQPNRWTYNACKGAILSLTRCQALDLAGAGIRVNSVSPGWILTPEVEKAFGDNPEQKIKEWGHYHMLRRLGQPVEVARAIAFLCSSDASFITGVDLPVDGGYLAMGPERHGDTSSFSGSM
jgi:NAD(P)-dependent dehydrogenase (short-subunit alcohol dehydrogenase family)